MFRARPTLGRRERRGRRQAHFGSVRRAVLLLFHWFLSHWAINRPISVALADGCFCDRFPSRYTSQRSGSSDRTSPIRTVRESRPFKEILAVVFGRPISCTARFSIRYRLKTCARCKILVAAHLTVLRLRQTAIMRSQFHALRQDACTHQRLFRPIHPNDHSLNPGNPVFDSSIDLAQPSRRKTVPSIHPRTIVGVRGPPNTHPPASIDRDAIVNHPIPNVRRVWFVNTENQRTKPLSARRRTPKRACGIARTLAPTRPRPVGHTVQQILRDTSVQSRASRLDSLVLFANRNNDFTRSRHCVYLLILTVVVGSFGQK